MATSRRGLLFGAAGLAAIAWSWQRFGVRKVNLAFEPIPGLAGWQRAETGATSLGGSATGAVFLGIGDEPVHPLPASRLCDILYASEGPGLTVTVFTDINCPYCRRLEAKLAARSDRVSVNFLELPLLGSFSEAAARVSIAANILSGEPSEPPQALRGTGIAAVILYHAERSGLDPERLGDMADSPEVKARLDLQRGAASTLGIFGTPGMTIGKTLVMGDVSSEVLDQLLAMEHAACG